MPAVIQTDDQPIEASFFHQADHLTDFIVPDALEVQALYKTITEGLPSSRERILACWEWVASKVRYVRFVQGKLWINGHTSYQKDLWQTPSQVILTRVGNCANKSFLLTSLLRNELPPNQVHTVLGNLHNGKSGGHAWLQLTLDDGETYTMESTMPTAPPLVPAFKTTRYEAVHFFNDKSVYAVAGRTQMIPFTDCYSTWLRDYLNWSYIDEQKK